MEQQEEEKVEKQGESSTGKTRDPAVELGEEKEGIHWNFNVDENPEEVDVSNSLLSNSSCSYQDLVNASKTQDFYSCVFCGKVYIYLVSFRKHIRSHSAPQALPKRQSPEKHRCLECGMTFLRKARLLNHLRLHKSYYEPRKCDLCNKYFGSLKLWIAHNHFHEQKPFWCLSCAKGFLTDVALDKHLLRHSQMTHVCTVCQKSFPTLCHLKLHSKSHTEAKPYKCKLCGKSFSFLGNLISHRKKHRKGFVGFTTRPPGTKNSELLIKKKCVQKMRFSSIEEESEMYMNKDDSNKKEEHQDGREPRCEDSEDCAHSEESDCGEPMHRLRPYQPPGSDGPLPPDGSNSLSVKQQGGQESRMHREHKYWEWECCECDMGFDEMAKLHLHYIKHATGEIAIPEDAILQDELNGHAL